MYVIAATDSSKMDAFLASLPDGTIAAVDGTAILMYVAEEIFTGEYDEFGAPIYATRNSQTQYATYPSTEDDRVSTAPNMTEQQSEWVRAQVESWADPGVCVKTPAAIAEWPSGGSSEV